MTNDTIPDPNNAFHYRILLVEDEATLRMLGTEILRARGYEVLTADDGLLGLAALKQSLPDIIISDLAMPNMDGFEFLSVVRRRFPLIPVIVVSGEFTGISVPESVLADAFFSKGQYRPDELFATIVELLHELPTRPRAGKPSQAAVWVSNAQGTVSISCTDCLRTFPVIHGLKGDNEAQCIFCGCIVHFEIIGERRTVSTATGAVQIASRSVPAEATQSGAEEYAVKTAASLLAH